jgi:hypothetical protein
MQIVGGNFGTLTTARGARLPPPLFPFPAMGFAPIVKINIKQIRFFIRTSFLKLTYP